MIGEFEYFTMFLAASLAGGVLSVPVFLAYRVISGFFQLNQHTGGWWLYLRNSITNHCRAYLTYEFAIVAILSIVIFNILFLKFGYELHLLVSAIFIYSLLLLAAIDLKTQYLPDLITKPLIILGLIQGYMGIFANFKSSVFGAIAGYLILWSLNTAFRKLRGIDGMGYGDFKLLAALGAWVGVQMLPLILLISSVVGIFIALLIIKLTKEDIQAPTPFGPSLVFAGFVAFTYGRYIIDWYLAFLQVN